MKHESTTEVEFVTRAETAIYPGQSVGVLLIETKRGPEDETPTQRLLCAMTSEQATNIGKELVRLGQTLQNLH